MKLIYRIIIRIALMLTVVLRGMGCIFYIAVIDEVNDEVDDSLEDYSGNHHYPCPGRRRTALEKQWVEQSILS